MPITTRLDIRFVGLPVPSFRPRWRCADAPVLRVVVGRARAIQQALAVDDATLPRLAIVVGTRHDVVDCADLVVRVPDLRAARRACGVLVSLAASRRETLIETEAEDLAGVVAVGRGREGVIARCRGDTLVDAARQLRRAAGHARPDAMVVRMTPYSRPGGLHDLVDAMTVLGDVGDRVEVLHLGLRDPLPPRPWPTIELLGALPALAAANDDDDDDA
jgi:hypothetical protein